MKHIGNFITLLILLIPCMLLSLAVIKSNIILGIISITLLFCLVFGTPITNGIENFWMYVLSSITLFPLNVKIAIIMFPVLYDLFYSKALAVLTAIIITFVISNVQQIVLGLITRFIKPKQKEINVYEFL